MGNGKEDCGKGNYVENAKLFTHKTRLSVCLSVHLSVSQSVSQSARLVYICLSVFCLLVHYLFIYYLLLLLVCLLFPFCFVQI